MIFGYFCLIFDYFCLILGYFCLICGYLCSKLADTNWCIKIETNLAVHIHGSNRATKIYFAWLKRWGFKLSNELRIVFVAVMVLEIMLKTKNWTFGFLVKLSHFLCTRLYFKMTYILNILDECDQGWLRWGKHNEWVLYHGLEPCTQLPIQNNWSGKKTK